MSWLYPCFSDVFIFILCFVCDFGQDGTKTKSLKEHAHLHDYFVFRKKMLGSNTILP